MPTWSSDHSILTIFCFICSHFLFGPGAPWFLFSLLGPFLCSSSSSIHVSFAASLEVRVPPVLAAWNSWSSLCSLLLTLAIHLKGSMQAAALEWTWAENSIPEKRAFHFIGQWNTPWLPGVQFPNFVVGGFCFENKESAQPYIMAPWKFNFTSLFFLLAFLFHKSSDLKHCVGQSYRRLTFNLTEPVFYLDQGFSALVLLNFWAGSCFVVGLSCSL